MKVLLACLVSSLEVGLIFAAYSLFETGFRVEMLGVGLIAFLYALAVALLVGLPFRFAFRALGKVGGIYYGSAGALVGAGMMIVPMVASFRLDSSTLKTVAVLALAGFVAGWTFDRISNYERPNSKGCIVSKSSESSNDTQV